MKKLLGVLILTTLVGILFGASVWENGWLEATVTWAISIGFVGLLALGIELVTGD